MIQIRHALIVAVLVILPTAAFAEDAAQPVTPESAAHDLIAAKPIDWQESK